LAITLAGFILALIAVTVAGSPVNASSATETSSPIRKLPIMPFMGEAPDKWGARRNKPRPGLAGESGDEFVGLQVEGSLRATGLGHKARFAILEPVLQPA
jgi:hypothetical protein